MTVSAAPISSPSVWPAASDDRQTSTIDGESFADVLDATSSDEDAAAAEIAATAPAPSAPPETPKPATPALDGTAAGDTTIETTASATAAFQAALNQLASTDSASATTPNQADTASTDAPAAADDATTAVPNGASQTATAQSTSAALILASAAGLTAPTGTQASGSQTTGKKTSDSPDETVAADGTVTTPTPDTTLLATTPAPVQAAVQPTAAATGNTDAGIQPASLKGPAAPTTPVPTDDADGAQTADAAKPANASQSQGASPAQANTQSVAPASAQANPKAPANAAVDAALQAAPDANLSAPQVTPAAQAATTSNPLADAGRAAATPPALQSAPAATIQVYSQIIERNDGRAQRFEMRLDPVELGRVDVRIEIGADRKVQAVLAAHDSAALSDLVRGQRALERALSDAGIDIADNGVRFELSADTGRGGASHQNNDASDRTSQPNVWRNFETAMVPVTAEAAAVVTPTWRPQRLDLVA